MVKHMAFVAGTIKAPDLPSDYTGRFAEHPSKLGCCVVVHNDPIGRVRHCRSPRRGHGSPTGGSLTCQSHRAQEDAAQAWKRTVGASAKLAEYEAGKLEIGALARTAQEYETMLRSLADRLGV